MVPQPAAKLLGILALKIMNKIIRAALVLIFAGACAAPAKLVHKKAKKLWAGTWVGKNGSDSVVLYLIQDTPFADTNYQGKRISGLYGWHATYRNATLIESSLEYAGAHKDTTFTIAGAYVENVDSVILVIRDLVHERHLGGYLYLKQKDQAELKTYLKETWRYKPYHTGDSSSFPKQIQLSRISRKPFRN
jgi:hypothetical protein